MAKTELKLTGYCMKTKKKKVPLVDATIECKNGRYYALGHDGSKDQNKMSVILNKETAAAHIAAGNAKAGKTYKK